MKVLILHDEAGVMLRLKEKLIEHGFEVEYHYFRVQDDPYIDYGLAMHRISKEQLAGFVVKKTMLAKYDILHTNSTRFPNHPLPYEFLIAKMRKKKVVVHFHGADLRLGWKKVSSQILLKNKTILVSTPDLLQFCPKHAEWLPNPCDPKIFVPTSNAQHEELRILHSSTLPEIKGTKYLVSTVDKLRKEGCKIDLCIVGASNPVPYSNMPQLYGWCDLVVNEMLMPLHSLVGIEAMMCNRLVLSHFQTPAFIKKAPIIYVDTINLAEKLRYFCYHKEQIKELARRGREWALEFHDPEKVVRKLIKIYENA